MEYRYLSISPKLKPTSIFLHSLSFGCFRFEHPHTPKAPSQITPPPDPRPGAYPYPHRLFPSPQKSPAAQRTAEPSITIGTPTANYARLYPPEDLFGLECDVIGAWMHEFKFKCTRESFVKRIRCMKTRCMHLCSVKFSCSAEFFDANR